MSIKSAITKRPAPDTTIKKAPRVKKPEKKRPYKIWMKVHRSDGVRSDMRFLDVPEELWDDVAAFVNLLTFGKEPKTSP